MLTRLDAVNKMLDTIGESPVSSLQSGLADAETAERILNRTSERVQGKGWHVNTEYNVKLMRDGDNKIPVPANALRLDSWGTSRSLNVVMRDGFLYDLTNKTFTFSGPVYTKIIYHLEFDELTYALQWFITVEAGVEFQRSSFGSVNLDAFQREEYNEAKEAVMVEEADNSDSNVLRDNFSTWVITRRNNNLHGY